MYSSYGQWIIKRIGEVPETHEVTAVIRHSERPDFKDVPLEKWNSTLLTSYGEKSALEFGTALVKESAIPIVAAKGWGLERCQITAERIAEGAQRAGSTGSRFSSISGFDSPISDLSLYQKYLSEGRYFEMVKEWVNGDSSDSPLAPYGPYSRDIISKIVNGHMSRENPVTIIVTHDLYILPMLNHIFGGQVTEVGFMDGILIESDENNLLFYTKNSEKSLSKSDF